MNMSVLGPRSGRLGRALEEELGREGSGFDGWGEGSLGGLDQQRGYLDYRINSLGAQLPAISELCHWWGGSPALCVAFLHWPALGTPLLDSLRLLEPLPQLCVPVSGLPPSLPPQLHSQCGGEPRAARAHLRLLLRGLQWVPEQGGGRGRGNGRGPPFCLSVRVVSIPFSPSSHPRKCFHCVYCGIPQLHAPHLHSLAAEQEAHSKSGGTVYPYWALGGPEEKDVYPQDVGNNG